MQRVEPRIAVTAAQPAVTRSDLPPVLDCVTVVGPVQPAADRVKEPAQPVAGQAVTIRDETPVSGTRCATHTYGIPTVEVTKTARVSASFTTCAQPSHPEPMPPEQALFTGHVWLSGGLCGRRSDVGGMVCGVGFPERNRHIWARSSQPVGSPRRPVAVTRLNSRAVRCSRASARSHNSAAQLPDKAAGRG